MGIGTYDNDGWTVLTPSVDSRVIYVSTSGSDSNSGLSSASPVQTFAKAMTLVRTGYPDWVLFKRGDSWTGQDTRVKKCGRSASEPMVFGAYGTGARPILNGDGPNSYTSTNPGGFVFQFLVFVGIHFKKTASDQSAISIKCAFDSVLIEGCKFEGLSTGLNIDSSGSGSNLTVRRNVCIDIDAQGFFIVGCDYMLIEENILDYNGWGSGGYGGDGNPGSTIFKHNMYLRNQTNLTVRNNITSRASYMGIKIAGDAVNSCTDINISGNLIYSGGLSMSAGSGAAGIDTFRFNRCAVSDNIFTATGREFTGTSGGTSSLAVYDTNGQEIVYDNNYFVHNNLVGTGGEMFNWGGVDRHLNVTVENSIVYNWDLGSGLAVAPRDYFEFYNEVYREYPGAPGITNFQLLNNQINQSASTYLDPTRTVGKYYASIGGTDDAVAFVVACRSQEKGNWNTAYTATEVNAYIREGFSPPGRTYFIQTGGLTYTLQTG